VLDRFVATLQRFLQDLSGISQDRTRRVVLGHSLGANAALHFACRRPDLFGAVATGSAALWWPGDEVQMPGGETSSTRSLRPQTCGCGCRPAAPSFDLLPRNRDLWERGDAAGLELVHLEHPRGHSCPPGGAVSSRGLPHLLGQRPNGRGET
jgi:enterochelin esterase-like enzyme